MGNEILWKDGECGLHIGNFFGYRFFNPFFIQLFVNVFHIHLPVQELGQRIYQIREELQVFVRSQIVDAYFIHVLPIEIEGEKGSGLAFPMEIPMKTIGCFAREIDDKVRDFHVRQEIVENERRIGMYDD